MSRIAICATGMAVTCALVIGCSGGGSSEPPAGTIKAATGGTVSLSGGPSVQIPAGALAVDTVVTVQQSTIQAPNGAVTPVYEFGPSGTTFSKPVTVTIPVPAGTTDGAIWTRQEGATTFTSVPTTISGGVATAQVTHFSVYLVGSVDLSGTWAGQIDYSGTNADGTAGTPGSTMQARDVTQNVGDVTVAITNASGSSATCTGTVSGAMLSTACTHTNFDGNCTATYEQTGTVSGSTWINASSFTWTGAACPSKGMTIAVQNSPLTKRSGPPRNIAGTYARVTSWTQGGPTVSTISGTSTGTVVRTQAASSSAVQSTVTSSGGAVHNCLGVVVDDELHGYCKGTNGSVVILSNGSGTISSGSPVTIHTTTQSTLQNAGAYTWQTSTSDDTRGCVSIAGNWVYTTHCDAQHIGKTLPLSQSGCTATGTDPIDGSVGTLQVTESSVAVTVAGQSATCQGSVTGNTLSLTCTNSCSLVLARQ